MTSQISAPSFDSHPLSHVDNYLEIGQKADASDVHLGVAAPPIWRVNGTLQPIWPDAPVLTGEQALALAEAFMPEECKQELNTRGDSDFAYENEHARYRVSVVRQRFGRHRQIHDACCNDSANQHGAARSHHHARGPHRIRHPLKELSR